VNPRRRRFVALVGAVLLLDYATALLAQELSLPFYLDTWATSTGVVVGGLAVGVVGGVLYNLLMAATVWGPSAWVWSLSSTTAALCTWFFLRRGWVSIERPFAMVASGMLTGVVNGCLSPVIYLVAFGGAPTSDNTRAFRELLHASIGNSGLAVLGASVVIEVADKTVSIITAAATAFLLRDAYRWARSHHVADGGAAVRAAPTRSASSGRPANRASR
jgi:hypothetical protein